MKVQTNLLSNILSACNFYEVDEIERSQTNLNDLATALAACNMNASKIVPRIRKSPHLFILITHKSIVL